MLLSTLVEIRCHFNMFSSPGCISIIYDFCSYRSLNLFGMPVIFVVGRKIIIHNDD